MTSDHASTVGPRRRPASTDVARLAGVSQKTVSRVMNGEPHVRPDVITRVLHAAEQLGYRRNGAARALNSGRTHRIGVISLGTGLYGPASLLVATERAARRHGYGVSVAHTAENEPGGIVSAVEALIDQGLDGLVLSEPIDEGPITISIDIPVLTLGRYPGLGARQLIHTQDISERAGYLATRFLLGLGHTEIRHLAGPSRWWSARDREAGWRRALLDANEQPVEPVAGDWLPRSGYEAGRRLARDPSMTAVFAANDDMAIGLMRALRDAGRRIPDDVSVISIDDVPAAAFCSPSLSTVVQSFDAVVDDGMTRLINAIENPGAPLAVRSDDELPIIERESTAPPPTAHRRLRTGQRSRPSPDLRTPVA